MQEGRAKRTRNPKQRERTSNKIAEEREERNTGSDTPLLYVTPV